MHGRGRNTNLASIAALQIAKQICQIARLVRPGPRLQRSLNFLMVQLSQAKAKMARDHGRERCKKTHVAGQDEECKE
jgi:hypothetical protein